jgi:transposase
MLGKRSAQRGLFEADHLYLDHVGRDTFYGFLASQRGRLFRDEDFAALYCLDNGRASVPPGLLATALLLQAFEGVSDEEAKARADFDLRWKVALGVPPEARPFAKSTLQLFRAQLILHERVRAVFRRSLSFARETGYLKSRGVKAVLDTSHVLGRGAVKDTYNLLADGIAQLARALAALAGSPSEAWAAAHDLARYFGSSLKGEAAIDWDDPAARRAFLGGVVGDADRLLALAREALASHPAGGDERPRLRAAAALLGQLLLQDIERRPDGPALKRGVSRDRVVSVHDPEMRHGRKSATKRFDGHKAAIAVEPESQLITAAAVLAGNAQDREGALDLVEQTEANAGVAVTETIGDGAFGDGETRRAFAEAGRKLVARVPRRPRGARFAKEDFRIELATRTCVCPAGAECRELAVIGGRKGPDGAHVPILGFRFAAALCDACHLRAACVAAAPGKGRTVALHPREAELQAARAFQGGADSAPYRRWRQAVEHRLARLMQLGVRQARYFGRSKTLFQLLLAATVANLTLVATKVGLMRGRKPRPDQPSAFLSGFAAAIAAALSLSLIPTLGQRLQANRPGGGSRPHF